MCRWAPDTETKIPTEPVPVGVAYWPRGCIACRAGQPRTHNLGTLKVQGNLFGAFRELAEPACQLRIAWLRRGDWSAAWPRLAHLKQIVRHEQRCHHQHARLAALPRSDFDTFDAPVDLTGHGVQVLLLTILAAHGVGVTVDAESHLRHRNQSPSLVGRRPEGLAQTIDQSIDSCSNFYGIHRRLRVLLQRRISRYCCLSDPFQRRLQPIGRHSRVVAVARHSPALSCLALARRPGESLNVKQYPAVVIHNLADARGVLAFGRPVTLLSARGAALFAGSGWWRALLRRTREEHPDIRIADILDCADASGLALGALRIGQLAIVLDAAAPGWSSVASIAESLGGEVLTVRPPALDMSNPAEAWRLKDWLQGASRPG